MAGPKYLQHHWHYEKFIKNSWSTMRYAVENIKSSIDVLDARKASLELEWVGGLAALLLEGSFRRCARG